MTSLLTSSARRSNLDRIERAASSSRHPVEISQTNPLLSRNLAMYVPTVTTMRSVPSRPVVTGAVLALPVDGFQRANRWPFFVNYSAPWGIGFVAVFL